MSLVDFPLPHELLKDPSGKPRRKDEQVKTGLMSRLPKWASGEIERLRGEVTYLRKEIATMNGTESRISFGYSHDGREMGHIPEGPVFYRLGTNPHDRVTISMKPMDDGTMELNINAAEGPIAVHPWAANTVTIRVVKP